MALTFGGNAVTSLNYNGTNINAVFFDGTQVIGPSGSQIYSTPGAYTFTVPSGVYSLNVCMIGGGGSGAANNNNSTVYAHGPSYAGGGYSGAIVEDTIEVEPGDGITVTIGSGGVAVSTIYTSTSTVAKLNGLAGGTTSFGPLVAAGGAGGTYAPEDIVLYKGNGASRTTCIGTANDGVKVTTTSYIGNEPIVAYGGQAGFAAGGNGRTGADIVGYSGSMGSGGGGVTSTTIKSTNTSGKGGNGYVKITWGID